MQSAGVSIAAVSMANGVNANLARRWIIDSMGPTRESTKLQLATPEARAPKPSVVPPFVPLTMPSSDALSEIHIELRRGTTAISVTWPTAAACECAAWMRELLR